MESGHLKKALQSRRGKGIDVSIILGSPDEHMAGASEEAKKSDLAPPGSHSPDVDHAVPEAPMHPEMSSPLSGMHDSDLLDGMSDYDKHQSSGRDPRSLGERARKEMILASTAKK